MTAQVFISYAHADNQSFDKETRGWVTNFVDNLQKAIAMKPGGSGVHFWMDHRLEPQRVVDETLRGRIRDSQCIVAFLSPRYLESEWCCREMAAFVELVGGGAAGDRVFLVEILPTSREQWHPGIGSISVMKLWEESLEQPVAMTLGWPVPNPKADRPYWTQLNSLAGILAGQLQSLPPAPPPEVPPATVIPAASPSPPLPITGPLSVMVNADQPDRNLAKQVQDLLEQLEVEATLAAEPLPTQLPAQYRRDLEAELEGTHGVLIVYGAAPPSWVQSQHALARKVLAIRRTGVWGALLEGPPEEKPDLGLSARSLGNLMLLDCRRGLSPAPLKHFVETLRQGGAHV